MEQEGLNKMICYTMEWDSSDIKGAIEMGFSYLEKMDRIVGGVYTDPMMAKKIVLSVPNEVEFDYIPEGIGIIRTAYFKMRPSLKSNEIRFEDKEKETQLKIFLT